MPAGAAAAAGSSSLSRGPFPCKNKDLPGWKYSERSVKGRGRTDKTYIAPDGSKYRSLSSALESVGVHMTPPKQTAGAKRGRGRRAAAAPARKRRKGSSAEKVARKLNLSQDSSSSGAGDAKETTGNKKELVAKVPLPVLPKTGKKELLPFVDPCGRDVHDLGVEELVGEQVDKLRDLLPASRAALCKEFGKHFKVGTACSGTESPVLGLMMTVEQMSAGRGGNKAPLPVKHVMSCEIEPFKQSYIARNFPGALLFPDITKLVPDKGTETPTVFGGVRTVPSADLFVAGTVCKDFSARKTSYRLDIEDKGKSGQTFFGACEYMFEHHPPYVVMENVSKAPWVKMFEYITGVIAVKTIYDQMSSGQKIVSSKKTQDDEEDKELTFTCTDKNKLVVDEVPRSVGVRAGAKLIEIRGPRGRRPVTVPSGSAHGWGEAKKGGSLTLKSLRKLLSIQGDESLVFDTATKHGYRAKVVRVDTKRFGLPQTRNRGYLFAWRPEVGGDEIGPLWEELVRMLESPAKFSLRHYLLRDDDERVRRYREVLRGPAGARAASHVAAEWGGDWYMNTGGGNVSADSKRAKKFRKEEKLVLNLDQEKSLCRPLTGWGPRGIRRPHMPLWPELAKVIDSRQSDMMDCFWSKASQSDPPFDPLHQGVVWDISQNVDQTSHKTRPGITGCICPGGWLYVPDLGRCIIGYEMLLLNGIPAGRLLLGQESEVQLADLAGNAMSLPVVNACILAALCVKEFARKRAKDPAYDPAKRADDAASSSDGPTRGGARRAADAAPPTGEPGAARQLCDLADLAKRAEASSILCQSESSAGLAASGVLECKDCGVTLSRDHAAKVHISSHNLVAQQRGGKEKLPARDEAPAAFERVLRRKAPPLLRLHCHTSLLRESAGGAAAKAEEMTLLLRLQDVRRGEGRWTLRYAADAPHGGVGAGGLSIHVGRICRGGPKRGVLCELRSFERAARGEGGEAPVVARFVETDEDKDDAGVWEQRGEPQAAQVSIAGSNPKQSFRAELGSVKFAGERWPDTLRVSATGPGADLFNARCDGTYKRATCRGSVADGTLFKKEVVAKTGQQPAYLYLLPDKDRTGLSQYVFAGTPSYHDAGIMTLAELPGWTPGKALKPGRAAEECRVHEWKEVPKSALRITAPTPTTKVVPAEEPKPKVGVAQAVDVLKVPGVARGPARRLLTLQQNDDAGGPRGELPMSGAIAASAARGIAAAVGNELLRSGVPKEVREWQDLAAPREGWGHSTAAVPVPPPERWVDGGVRGYDARASNTFEHELADRPQPWRVRVSPAAGGTASVDVAARPAAIAHRAAAALCGRVSAAPEAGAAPKRKHGVQKDSGDGAIRCSWLVKEMVHGSGGGDVGFSLRTNKNEQAPSPPHFLLPLYDRQRRALKWWRSIEAAKVSFTEEEQSEHPMPGIVGWSLIARAELDTFLRGGVLGDKMGGGKTCTTIAVTAAGRDDARRARDPDRYWSSATLVVCPANLVQQWDDERRKFTGSALTCRTIHNAADLLKLRMSDLLSADLVIASVELLAEPEYLASLRDASGHAALPAAFPTYVGHKEPESLRGIWVPAHPAQPFGQAKGKQQHREQAAHFTAQYVEAVRKLRAAPKGKGDAPLLEGVLWERVVLDEVHAACCTNGKGSKTSHAARELLGVAARGAPPLRARRGVWGLTGTPMLNDAARVQELARMCGGSYLLGAERHWRQNERASTRDQFLRMQEPQLSSRYRARAAEHAQSWLDAAVRRNKCDEYDATQLRVEVEAAKMGADTAKKYLRCIKGVRDVDPGDYAPASDRLPASVWEDLLDASATAPERGDALRRLIARIHDAQATKAAKVVVFAEEGDALDAARTALTGGARAAALGGVAAPVGGGAEQARMISDFAQPDVTPEDRKRPRVLLLGFGDAAGLNLQYSCRHAILFAPVWDDDAVSACAMEQQAIGRIHRPGQTGKVVVHRIILKAPGGRDAADAEVLKRNTRPATIAAATSDA